MAFNVKVIFLCSRCEESDSWLNRHSEDYESIQGTFRFYPLIGSSQPIKPYLQQINKTLQTKQPLNNQMDKGHRNTTFLNMLRLSKAYLVSKNSLMMSSQSKRGITRVGVRLVADSKGVKGMAGVKGLEMNDYQ